MTAVSMGRESLFQALKKIGRTAEQDIYTWSQGMAFHNSNLLEGLEAVPAAKRDRILEDVWTEVSKHAPEKVKKAMGLEKDVNVNAVDQFMSKMAADKNFGAIKGVGDDVEEALLNWVRAFAIFDYSIYTLSLIHI